MLLKAACALGVGFVDLVNALAETIELILQRSQETAQFFAAGLGEGFATLLKDFRRQVSELRRE